MTIRKASTTDIDGILQLQSLNLVTNLNEEQKKNGFVTTPFDQDKLNQLIQLEGIFVIEQDSKIKAYAMAAGWDYFSQWPMFPFMLERFSKLSFGGLAITRSNSFQYGPVCVDTSLRGTDAFPQLFSFMKVAMSEKFPIGTTFINKKNPRSLAAHTRKAFIEVFDEFEYNNNQYWGLGFLTTSQNAQQST